MLQTFGHDCGGGDLSLRRLFEHVRATVNFSEGQQHRATRRDGSLQHLEQFLPPAHLRPGAGEVVGQCPAQVMRDEAIQQIFRKHRPARLDHILPAEKTHVTIADAMDHIGGRSFQGRLIHVAARAGKFGFHQNTSAFVADGHQELETRLTKLIASHAARRFNVRR
jgi:hypothetical protein